MIIFLLIVLLIIFILNKKLKFIVNFTTKGLNYDLYITFSFLGKDITLRKNELLKLKDKMNRKRKKKLETDKSKKKINYINVLKALQFNKINLSARIGINDALLTSMIVPVTSTVLATMLEMFFPSSIKRFAIRPVYNKFHFELNGEVYISVKLGELMLVILKEFFTNKK